MVCPELNAVIEFVALSVTSHEVPLLFNKSIWYRLENVALVLPVPPFATFARNVTVVLAARLPVFKLGTPAVKSIVPAETFTVAFALALPAPFTHDTE